METSQFIVFQKLVDDIDWSKSGLFIVGCDFQQGGQGKQRGLQGEQTGGVGGGQGIQGTHFGVQT